jgi:malic enzyme
MVLAAARELARGAERRGVTPHHILPTMEEPEVFPEVAAAVADASVRLGVARRRLSHDEYLSRARALMGRPARLVRALGRSRLIPPMPGARTRRRRSG